MIALLAALAFAATPEALLAKGDYDAAMAAAEKVLAKNPDDMLALSVDLRAALASYQADPTQSELMIRAQADSTRIQAIAPRVLDAMLAGRAADLSMPLPPGRCPKASDLYLEKAWEAGQEHDGAKVREWLRKRIDECPTDSETWVDIGASFDGEQKWAEGIDAYQTATRLDPHDWAAWTALARARFANGDADAAVDALSHAVAANPGDRDARYAVYELAPLLGRDPWVDLSPQPGPLDTVPDHLPTATAWNAWKTVRWAGDGGLESERAAVEAGLRALGDTAVPAEDLWWHLRAAKAADRLDGAIFIRMWDPPLRADYAAWRETHPGAAEQAVLDAMLPAGSPGTLRNEPTTLRDGDIYFTVWMPMAPGFLTPTRRGDAAALETADHEITVWLERLDPVQGWTPESALKAELPWLEAPEHDRPQPFVRTLVDRTSENGAITVSWTYAQAGQPTIAYIDVFVAPEQLGKVFHWTIEGGRPAVAAAIARACARVDAVTGSR